MPAPLSSLDEFLSQLDDDGRLVHVERFPATAAINGTLDHPLPPELWAKVGLDALWSHQAEAINHARAGRSVAVATGTASGKSLCYQLPIAEVVAHPVRPGAALLLFPTKALAHDQLRSLAEFEFADVVPATYDGDSNPEQRTWVRNNANVVLTNPEMLHHGVLPHHGRWSTFLMRLQFVVIDELHVLRGIFGTHVAHLLRRLRRVAKHYGADPTFIFSSATIGQPGRLASELCGLPVAEVDTDGSPRGPRTFALLNPPIIDEESGVRTSTNSETAVVTAGLVRSGHRTISFCRSRKGTELVAADIARRLPADQRDQVKPYRAGYLAAERREIEDELFSGQLKAVVATSALELGVDIGGLDAVVLNGFPGTIASMWQQAGRAGRELQESASVLIAGDDALDQWLMAHPTEVFNRQPEPAVINIANPFIAVPHLACAAYEQPLAPADERWWPAELLHDGVRDLVREDALRLRIRRGEPQAVWATRGYPSRGMGLRNGGGSEFRIAFADGTLIGTVDESRAYELVHPGAIYLHRGVSYEVTELDREDRVAIVHSAKGDTYTQTRSAIEMRVVGSEQHRDLGRCQLHLGAVEVSSQVTGYQIREVRTRRIVGNEYLEMPENTLTTRAFWYVIDDDVLAEAGFDAELIPGALHAAEHVGIGILPLFTICDRWDVGGVSIAFHADTGGPTIFIHDAYQGGAGIAELGFAAADRHLHATLEALEACGCAAGCPSCVQSPKCGNGNEPLEKDAATAMLRLLVAGIELGG